MSVSDQSWVKLDTSFLTNDKWLDACDQCPTAANIWIASIAMAYRDNTDGHITKVQAKRVLFASKNDIDYLLSHRMWDIDGDGYCVHDYLDYQQSAKERAEYHHKKSAAGRSGGKAKAGAKQVLKQEPSKCSSKKLADKTRLDKTRLDKTRLDNLPIIPQGDEDTQSHELTPDLDNDLSQSFEAFWSVYPCHDGREGAQKAYKRAMRPPSLTKKLLIQQGAERYAKWVADGTIEPKYVKMASSWLSNGLWDMKRPPAWALARKAENAAKNDRDSLQEILEAANLGDCYIDDITGELHRKGSSDVPYVTSALAEKLAPYGYGKGRRHEPVVTNTTKLTFEQTLDQSYGGARIAADHTMQDPDGFEVFPWSEDQQSWRDHGWIPSKEQREAKK